MILSFNDSEVITADFNIGILTIAFSVTSVKRDDGLVGYLTGVRLKLFQAIRKCHDQDCIGRIREGVFIQQDIRRKETVIPLQTTDSIVLELTFANDSRLHYAGQGFELLLADDAKFSESFHC